MIQIGKRCLRLSRFLFFKTKLRKEEKKMKNVEDIKVNSDFTIQLSDRMIQHLKVIPEEKLKVLFTEQAIILLKPEVFGEKILKN